MDEADDGDVGAFGLAGQRRQGGSDDRVVMAVASNAVAETVHDHDVDAELLDGLAEDADVLRQLPAAAVRPSIVVPVLHVTEQVDTVQIGAAGPQTSNDVLVWSLEAENGGVHGCLDFVTGERSDSS